MIAKRGGLSRERGAAHGGAGHRQRGTRRAEDAAGCGGRQEDTSGIAGTEKRPAGVSRPALRSGAGISLLC